MSWTIMTWKNTALGVVAAVAIAAPLTISCEEDEGGEVSSENAPEAVAQTVCNRYFACTCEMRDAQNVFSSPDACELALAQDLQEAIDEGEAANLTYNGRCPSLQMGIADTLACQSLTELILDLPASEDWEEYQNCKLFHGERGPGQSCEPLEHSNGDDCQPDLVCNENICITRLGQIAEGEACTLGQDACATGLVCIDVDGGVDNPTCESLPRGGATCKGTANLCDIDFTCEIETKTCVALPGVGEPCAEMPSVLQWGCARGALCEVEEDVCIAAPGGGEPCSGFCQEGFACEGGRCAEAAALICAADGQND
jgi:hypothetical protein